MSGKRKPAPSAHHPNNLQALRESRHLTREKVSEHLDVTATTIYRLEKQEQELTQGWMEVFAELYGVEVEDIIRTRLTVPLVGFVGAGQEIYAIDDHMKGAALEEIEVPPGMAKPGMVAVRVRGNSMEPAHFDGDTLFYRHRIEGGCASLLGKLCVVKLVDGPTCVKRLRRGYAEGRYNLQSFNADMIEDAHLEWCAKVEFTQPG